MLKDILPGLSGYLPSDLTVVRGKIFFSAEDGVHGQELWMSDGTEAGTVMVKDLLAGSEGGDPAFFTLTADGTLFFIGDDRELWKTDGTEAGTVKLKSFPQGMAILHALGNTLYFMAGDVKHGLELWRSDGTEAGTALIKDIHPGPGSSLPHAFTRVGDRLAFVAYDPQHGLEPWVTDGTTQGTVLLRDVLPGPAHGIQFDMTTGTQLFGLEERGLALFAATDGVQGLELWMTDGTPEGTVQVMDLFPGEGSSDPGGLMRLGDKLFLAATDAQYGREPHLLPLPTARNRTVPTVTCPANLTQETADANGTQVEYPPASASDTEGPPRLDYSTPSGSLFPVGTTAVTVTATDAADNRGECTFQVTVSLKPPASEPEANTGCGCAATSVPDVALLWLLLALLRLATRR
ncbi:ELWxxDGT repeat protein [Archangium sp.]|uniref:ELWxxDGT repeat protein n=1 Tax=Archangium sp. TaxID=1872627 RepID=UPI002D3EA94F|nr:ELWxxDGT repeat protein [Archangium sp.]HYO54880.1 ELWxxDGT repeat protein [Archangium sp.]